MNLEDTIQHLNELTEVCNDGERGYRTAAEHVNNTQLASVFADYSKQRKEFASHLQSEVRRLGGAADGSSTVIGALHRGWIDFKALVTAGDGGAVVAACETGDDAAAASFERVANLDLSGQTKSLVEIQWLKIVEAHTHMVRLKKETAQASFPRTESQ